MASSIDVVYRDWNTPSVPSSGDWEPKKPEIRALLKQIQNSGGQSVTRNTFAALSGVTPPTENYMGIVLDDADPTKNGYYSRVAAAWVWERGFPDTFARLDQTGGTNTVTAVSTAGINPASVEVYHIQPSASNSSNVTLSIDGAAPKPVRSVNGDELAPGEWTAGRKIMLVEEATEYRLLSDPDADGAAAAAAASATSASNSAASALTSAETAEFWAGQAEDIVGITGIASEAEAEDANETTASNVKILTVLRGLQAIRASLKQNGIVTPFQFGAVGDGVADDRAACQTAIDEAENEYGGATVYFPPAVYRCTQTDAPSGADVCLFSTGVSHLVGAGRMSIINPDPSASANTSTIYVLPNGNEITSGFTIDNLFLGDHMTGYRQGAHGIFFDTQIAGKNFPAPKITRNYICQSRDGSSVNYGKAFAHVNNEVNNINGGMYGALIANNRSLAGGVTLIQSGDSNTIKQNIISGLSNTGTGYECIGVDITLCGSDGGAGFITLEDLNITAEAGSYVINLAKDIYINRVYGEHLSANAGITVDGVKALAVIGGAGSTIFAGHLTGGRLAAATGVSVGVDVNLFVKNTNSLYMSGGTSFYPGKASGGIGIQLTANTVHNTVQRPYFAAGFTTPVSDLGTGNVVNL